MISTIEGIFDSFPGSINHLRLNFERRGLKTKEKQIYWRILEFLSTFLQSKSEHCMKEL